MTAVAVIRGDLYMRGVLVARRGERFEAKSSCKGQWLVIIQGQAIPVAEYEIDLEGVVQGSN